jgi:hypothetical protein
MPRLQRLVPTLAAVGVLAFVATGCQDSSYDSDSYPSSGDSQEQDYTDYSDSDYSDYQPDSYPDYEPQYQQPDPYEYEDERPDPAVDSDGNGRFNPSPLDPYQS